MTDAGLEFGLDGNAQGFIAARILQLETVPDGGDFGLRGLPRCAGLQPCFDRVGVIATVFQRVGGSGVEALSHHGWNVESRMKVLVDAGEGLRRDADDGEIDAFDAQVAADDGRILAQLRLPEIVADDDDGVATGDFTLFGQKAAAQDGLYAEIAEEIVAGDYAGNYLRQGLSGGCDAEGGKFEGDHAVKRLGFGLEVAKVGIGDAAEGIVGRGGADVHDRAGLEDGKRAEEEGVGEAEDRAVGADAEGEREGGDQGETGVLNEDADRITNVLKET